MLLGVAAAAVAKWRRRSSYFVKPAVEETA
ncbi:hypothetical protein BJY16_001403 [Actinoplanes octamycinicus]|uniref:Uncharacterized protein n=1 Tax=Actinoplanes octamycinicus TaxID=135948 RepID=A0A7W7M5P4_9ACTN|nr:hypothetical protein [Actinoplanes octamycinicus]